VIRFSRIAVEGQPYLFLLVLIADKRPQLVACDGQSALLFDRTRTSRGTWRYFSLTYAWSQLSETWTARAMPASEMRSWSRPYFGFPVPFNPFLMTLVGGLGVGRSYQLGVM
jgi:hypothetical protein